MDLAHVLYIGGGPGAGKTSVSRALAYRWDLQLYNVDHRTWDHFHRLGGPEPDWTRTPEQLVDDFVAASHRRWPLVLEDLAALPDSPAAIVEGPFVLPELVPPGAQAVFVVPTEEQIRRVRAERGSLPVIADRDVLLAQRSPGLPVDRPLDEMVELVASQFSLGGLPRVVDRPAIRRLENDVLARQLDLWPGYGGWEVPFACECDTPGCAEMIELTLAEYEAASAASGRSRLRAPRS
ncbi:MAG TPA: hypothetical protein VGU02_02075 [Gaiellaceae bacterium]|nr:hypothetical protein [Gaiellaceae bacterium]